jgi:hypothetical protein
MFDALCATQGRVTRLGGCWPEYPSLAGWDTPAATT